MFSFTRRAALASPALLAQPRRARPNVVLLITDDQGYGDLSLHGNPHLQTPHLDSIGRGGAQFTRFHVSPVCSPTRSSLMTGRYNYRTGVVDTYIGRSLMRPTETTLAERFRANGYRTGIFGKWHLGDNYPLRAVDQGFETALTHRGGGLAQPSGPPGNGYFDPLLERNGKPEKVPGYCTDIFYGEAAKWIEQNRRNPFFAYIATNAPHDPYQVDEKLVAPFRAQGLDDITAKIYAMVANVDTNVGRLLDCLRRNNLERDTIVIFMTDNGPQRARFNAGMRGLKGSVYEGGLRVPFFVKWPARIEAGTMVDRLAAHIDVFPTLSEMCGLGDSPGPRIDGRSLWPLLQSPAAPWPSRTLCFQWHRGNAPRSGENCAAITERYKLVNRTELYDLEKDPAEKVNIASTEPGVAAGLRDEYDRWFAGVSQDGYDPPRIIVGSPQEPVTLLTRQDCRGDGAQEGWDQRAASYWAVEVAASRSYDIEVRFPTATAPGTVRLNWTASNSEKSYSAGATSVRFPAVALPQGPARLSALQLTPGAEPSGAPFIELRAAGLP